MDVVAVSVSDSSSSCPSPTTHSGASSTPAAASAYLTIESLDHEARGIAHDADGKVVFVQDALPGEVVAVQITKRKPGYDQAKLQTVIKPSPYRVRPACPHFGVCGGCSMQHLDPAVQVAVKARVLEDSLWHIGRLKPEQVLSPMYGPSWGYRFRARLSARLVPKKGGMLVGFHERSSRYVADMTSCAILPPRVSALIMPLRACLGALSIADRVPQVELAIGEQQTVLVLRHLAPLTEADRDSLIRFANEYGIEWWLQPKGPDSIHPLLPEQPSYLSYRLPAFDIQHRFLPTDFTQVNHAVNASLVTRAVRLLQVEPHERVLDLFCGLGNFTLPLARLAKQVTGVEGSASLTRRAQENARQHGLQDKTHFHAVNLFEPKDWPEGLLQGFDKILIDPPREGARAVVEQLCDAQKSVDLKRLVYVSCNPATLARDAAILVHQGGFHLRAAGIVNMFPHTSHVESIAVFER